MTDLFCIAVVSWLILVSVFVFVAVTRVEGHTERLDDLALKYGQLKGRIEANDEMIRGGFDCEAQLNELRVRIATAGLVHDRIDEQLKENESRVKYLVNEVKWCRGELWRMSQPPIEIDTAPKRPPRKKKEGKDAPK